MTERPLHALSFDVEEFFQVANLKEHFPPDKWDDVPSRLDVGMDAILALLDAHGARATMFFLGWIAERHPALVRRCVDAGHEIASHGYEHKFLGEIATPEALDLDLARTEEALIAAGGPRPVGFRASTFTLTRDTWWAFDVLVARGYQYDSSVHPVRHPTYGVPDFEPTPSVVHAPGGGGEIVEFPVATYPMIGKNMPVGGGGYFRLLPGWLHRSAMRGLERKGRPVALYLHPWEFDPGQPRMEAPFLKRFRHYLNLDKSLGRLERLVKEFRFGTMLEALEERGLLSGAASKVS
ncbi:MAG: DUF3473 domain-containing protein [bacterium]|nr:DUF3473 domain-containing protein [bacterium]